MKDGMVSVTFNYTFNISPCFYTLWKLLLHSIIILSHANNRFFQFSQVQRFDRDLFLNKMDCD